MAHKKTSHKPGTYTKQQPPEQKDDIDIELAEWMFDAGEAHGRLPLNSLPPYDQAIQEAIQEYKAQKARKDETP